MITTTSSSKPYIYFKKKLDSRCTRFRKEKKKEKVNLILTTSNKRCLIKFQVDTIKADISYLHNKNINIMNREYTIRKFTEKPRQDYRSSYRYIKPHPSTRYRKQQKTLAENLAEITRRLETIEKELTNLNNSLHDLKQERETVKTKEETKKHIFTIRI